jgi:hypothetical protein
MSTFYGGEQLVNVVSLTGIVPSLAPGNIYTVPTGFYASVTIVQNSINFGTRIVSPIFAFTDIPVTTDTSNIKTFFLTAGSKIEEVTPLTSYYFVVRLYKTP